MTTTYPLQEIRAALRDLDAGKYSCPAGAGQAVTSLDRMHPATVGVMGVSGGVGATVVALALAETIGAARLIELSPSWASGLTEATTAELGQDQGWRLGTRGELLIERRGAGTAAVREVPGQAVIDAGAWTGDQPAVLAHMATLVVAAPCTIPGIRRLENLLSLSPADTHIVALVGCASVKAVPRMVLAAAGPQVRGTLRDRSLVTIPACSALRRSGITGDPLPKPLLAAAAMLTHSLKDVLP